MRHAAFFMVATAASLAAAVPFDVRMSGGAMSIFREGRPLVERVVLLRGDADDGDLRLSSLTTNGVRVWNMWSEAGGRQVRLEAAVHPQGHVELTMAGRSAYGEDGFSERRIRLVVPHAELDGKPWRAYDGRFDGQYERSGVFGPGFERMSVRYLAVGGMVFDFNPLGVGDLNASNSDGWRHCDGVCGVWTLRRDGRGYLFEAGSDIGTSWGGFVGAKLVLREGSFEDYGRHHAMASFRYSDLFKPMRLLAFGAPRFGKAYADGDVVYHPARGYGWKSTDYLRWPYVGGMEGAYYSHVGAYPGVGTDGVYRFTGLSDGWYYLTVSAGNQPGRPNRFRLTANGQDVWRDVSVPTGQVRTVTQALHVRGGALELDFRGEWIVSTIGLQFLMADSEDFSFLRPFWCSDGYEPGGPHRNCDWPGPVVPGRRDETLDLPLPGSENAGKARPLPPPETELPDPALPSLAWTRDASIYRLFNNSSLLDELDVPGALQLYFDREIDGRGYNAIMLSGMLSRHTFIGRIGSGQDAVRRIVAEAHRRGIKVIDHLDATLLWNIGQGFRVMTEHIDELNLSSFDRLPSFQYCLLNPSMRERLFRYLEEDVRNGVDAFQLDEAHFWHNRCVCRFCRERFRRDTGLEVPLDEASAAWVDPDSPFRRTWYAWRVRVGTDFFIDLRRRLKPVKADLVISEYTTEAAFAQHWGMIQDGRVYMDLGRVVNFFGVEVMCRTVLKNFRAELPTRRTQNMVALAYGTPIWDWYYSQNWQNDYAAWALSEMSAQTPLLSQVDHPPDAPDYRGFRAEGRAMKRVGAETCAELAMYFSSATVMSDPEKVFASDFGGTAQALEALHVPYDVLGDQCLSADRLGKYRVLCLGAARCLSDEQVEAVREFAKRGGTVRLTGLAGTCDGYGNEREEGAFAKDLADACGRTGVVRVPIGNGAYVYSSEPRGVPFHMKNLVVGKAFAYDADPAYEAAFREEVREWSMPAAWWRVDAPAGVYSSVWREADGTYAIHFFNATGVSNRHGAVVTSDAPNPAFPALPRPVAFTMPGAADMSATAESPDFGGKVPLESACDAQGRRTFLLPPGLLRAYSLVRVRKGGH